MEENKLLAKNSTFYLQCARLRSKKPSSYRQQDDEDSEDEDEEKTSKDYKEGNKGDKQIKKMKVQSLRLDNIVASGTNKSKK